MTFQLNYPKDRDGQVTWQNQTFCSPNPSPLLHLLISNSAPGATLSFLKKKKHKTNPVSENPLLTLGPGNKPLSLSDSLAFPLPSQTTQTLDLCLVQSLALAFFPRPSSSWSLDTFLLPWTPQLPLGWSLDLGNLSASYLSISTFLQSNPNAVLS